LANALGRSRQRIEDLCDSDLNSQKLSELQQRFGQEYQAALKDGSWIKTFRGRDVLSLFTEKFVRGMSYEYFRDLIITRMSELDFKPPGMSQIINSILED